MPSPLLVLTVAQRAELEARVRVTNVIVRLRLGREPATPTSTSEASTPRRQMAVNKSH
jgi:hypothetical protein